MLLRERQDRAPAQYQTTGAVHIIVDNDTTYQAMQDGYCVEGKRMAVSHFGFRTELRAQALLRQTRHQEPTNYHSGQNTMQGYVIRCSNHN